ncbi:MAG TPA: BtrH N-terminal domain-containing protein [Rectinemataceae bacterium]|nr:BtrH N-terminal domain-containing protein [Rectinemataceae bacterium]
MKKIGLPHKVLDYCCPINGLEDQYEWKTGLRLPGFFLMDMSNIGFIYLKRNMAPAPRMIGWGDGVGSSQYEFLADVMGFRLRRSEGLPFDEAWREARDSVDRGLPPILGFLDMFHLRYYPKFYHRYHIPHHFVTLVGYDEAGGKALIQDNGVAEVQALPLEELRQAWNVSVPGLGKRNTFHSFEFGEAIASPDEIAAKGLRKRAKLFLESPAGFMGLRGMRKAAAEFSLWKPELSEARCVESLRYLVTFSCSVVPNPPQRLLPYPLGYDDPHRGIRDRFSRELAALAGRLDRPAWGKAADLLRESGALIGALTEVATGAVLGEAGAFDVFEGAAPELMIQIADIEERAFGLLL